MFDQTKILTQLLNAIRFILHAFLFFSQNHSKIREVGPCVGKAMKAKGPEVCPAASIEYFKKMRKNLKEEITSIICADFDKDSCKNVEVPAITDAEYKGKSLYGPMRQLYQKVLV